MRVFDLFSEKDIGFTLYISVFIFSVSVMIFSQIVLSYIVNICWRISRVDIDLNLWVVMCITKTTCFWQNLWWS